MLGADDVMVFLARPEAVDRRDSVLDAEDTARVARYRFERDRRLAFASRTLQRQALSRCHPAVPPAAWRFVEGDGGRPAIAAPAGAERLRFNVANTAGLVVCAVTLDRELGIDAEPCRDDAPADIVGSHFAPLERAALRALPAAAQSQRFVELWTLKEAYVKARSVGLTVPLDRFWFELDGPPRLSLAPELGDDATTWQLALWAPTPSHCAALCVRGAGLRIEHIWL